jgi:hypothetical protein
MQHPVNVDARLPNAQHDKDDSSDYCSKRTLSGYSTVALKATHPAHLCVKHSKIRLIRYCITFQDAIAEFCRQEFILGLPVHKT